MSRGKIVSNGEWFHKDSVEGEIEIPAGVLEEQQIPSSTTTGPEPTTEVKNSTTPIPPPAESTWIKKMQKEYLSQETPIEVINPGKLHN